MDDIKIIICFKCFLKVVIICGSSFLLINVGFKCFFLYFRCNNFVEYWFIIRLYYIEWLLYVY